MSSSPCDCRAAAHTLRPPSSPLVQLANNVDSSSDNQHPTTTAVMSALLSPSPALNNTAIPLIGLVPLVRRPVSEHAQKRLVCGEAEPVEVRHALAAEPSRHAPLTAEPDEEEMSIDQLWLPRELGESEAPSSFSSDMASEMEYQSEHERQIEPRPLSTPVNQSGQEDPAFGTAGQALLAPRRRRLPCTVDGCSSLAQRRGMCYRHSGVPQCNEPGCEKSVQRKGKCWRHGGKRLCNESGCMNVVVRQCKCTRHSEKRLCNESDCVNVVIKKGKCWRHNEKRLCNESGCMNLVVRQYKCTRHCGKGRRLCSKPGCSSTSIRGGRCRRHGGADPCLVEGCTKLARSRGKCRGHGHAECTD